jgi:hypothetical protein
MKVASIITGNLLMSMFMATTSAYVRLMVGAIDLFSMFVFWLLQMLLGHQNLWPQSLRKGTYVMNGNQC